MTERDFFVERLRAMPVMAILRNFGAKEAVRLAERAWTSGISLVEVSVQDRDAFASLEAVISRARELGHVAGAGTVIDRASLLRARDLGAAFCVAPGFDERLVTEAQEMAMPYLPGLSSPTEAQAAVARGVRTAKLFPAGLLGPEWVRALRSPFPSLRMVAVGGVSASNAQGLLDAGAIGVGVGSALTATELERLASLRSP